jgi:hypothetical protein
MEAPAPDRLCPRIQDSSKYVKLNRSENSPTLLELNSSTDIQNVRTKGVQNKIIISQIEFIITINGIHHYKGKLSKLFSACITFLINLNVGSLDGTTNIQA